MESSLSHLLGWGASTIWCLFGHLKYLWQRAITILSNKWKANQKAYGGLKLDISATLYVYLKPCENSTFKNIFM